MMNVFEERPWYRSLGWEKWYPLAFCWTGAVILLLVRHWLKISAGDRQLLLTSLITAASVIFGFIGTVIAIVATFFTHRLMRALGEVGLQGRLMKYLLAPLYGLGLVILLSLILTGCYGRNWWCDTVGLTLLGASLMFTALTLFRLHSPLLRMAEQLNPKVNLPNPQTRAGMTPTTKPKA
jgi:hypothetical protein